MPITTTPSGGPQGEFSTYTPIYSTTLSSTASSITFSNIPTTFTDLVIVVNGYTNHTGAQQMYLQQNADTASNYSWTRVLGDGTSAASDRASSVGSGASGSLINNSSTNPSTIIYHILNYSNTTTYKTTLYRSNTAGVQVNAGAQLWRSTSVISSIKLTIPNSTYATGTTFTLYGIKAAATAPKATGGDIITTDGTYWYHAFFNSGLFDVKTSITADVLVVAGGGSGGARNGTGGAGGGGGGAGGLRLLASQSLTVSTYTATIGAGGVTARTPDTYTRGSSGSNSSFSGSGITTISTTGGGGGGITGQTVLTGGSGGGAGGGAGANATGATGNAGSYSPVEGYAGGNGSTDNSGAGSPYPAGGGGGAGGAGTSFSGSTPGTGGNGASSYNSISFSSWLTATGTGTGGVLAKGGNGGTWTSPSGTASDGVANTGSGGNGAGTLYGGSGGSGLVIVRYAV